MTGTIRSLVYPENVIICIVFSCTSRVNTTVMFHTDEVTVADLRHDVVVQRALLTKPRKLQSADLVTLDWGTCRCRYPRQITERMMCAEDPNNITDICSVSTTREENVLS